jgi:hypothetical protein
MTCDQRRSIIRFRKGGGAEYSAGIRGKELQGVIQYLLPLLRIMVVQRSGRHCRKSRIREDGLVCMPRVSVGLGVASLAKQMNLIWKRCCVDRAIEDEDISNRKPLENRTQGEQDTQRM